MILVAFYNKKALGVRYLESALEQAGYSVTTIFYKDFNSVHPSKTTQRELELLVERIQLKNEVWNREFRYVPKLVKGNSVRKL